MNSWNKRTREVAHLLNPAFCGRMLYSAINAYSIKTKRAFPFPLVYLVLPLVFLLCVRHEVNHCYHGVVSVLYRVVDQRQLLIQKNHLAFGQFSFLICHSAGFRDHAVEACKRREGRKLCRSVVHAHVRTVCRLVVRERQDLSVRGLLFGHHSSPALWPPIWPFRAMVVPPSIRFMPLSMAFFPNLS